MKKQDLWRKAYHLFHGNEDLNTISQVDLLMSGHGDYGRIYDTSDDFLVTDRNAEPSAILDSQKGSHRLVVKDIFNKSENAFRFVSGVHFTKDTVASASKSTIEKCSGRTIIELGKNVLKNIKKASVIADEWLNDGDLPSGKSYDDLYAHVVEVHEEKIFIGFMAFVSLTKYNEGGNNNLTVLQVKDDDINGEDSGRMAARKKTKLDKDDNRDIAAASVFSPFVTRGLSVEARVQVIEVAQFESQKIRDDYKQKILQLSTKTDILLRERSQQIELAKIICPIYDADEEVWKEVTSLTKAMGDVKKELAIVETSQSNALSRTDSTSNLVSQFLKSVVAIPTAAKDIVEVNTPKTNETSEVECVDVEDGSKSVDSLDDQLSTLYGNAQMNIEEEGKSKDSSSVSS